MNSVFITFKPEVASAAIADEIESWLHREAVASSSNNNAVLDDLDAARRNLQLPFDDPLNFNDAKHISHYNRQRQWGEDLIAEPTNNFVAARQVFSALMQMSGMSRRMRYVRVTDQAHYNRMKRTRDVPGIDVRAVVTSQVSVSPPRAVQDKTLLEVPTVEETHAATMAAFEKTREDLEYVRERLPGDFGQPQSESLARLALTQTLWCQVVTSSILMASGYRDGDLRRAPLLEPKSISENPQVYYPFMAKIV